MKTVRIMIAAVLIAASFSVSAQDAKSAPAAKSTTAAPALKDHKCNGQCNAAGHNYLHGEKGHTCTAACKKTATKKA